MLPMTPPSTPTKASISAQRRIRSFFLRLLHAVDVTTNVIHAFDELRHLSFEIEDAILVRPGRHSSASFVLANRLEDWLQQLVGALLEKIPPESNEPGLETRLIPQFGGSEGGLHLCRRIGDGED